MEGDAASLADFRHQIGLTAPYGPAAHTLDPAWSKEPPSRVFAAKLKAERERRRLERAAERAATLASRRKPKTGGDPPPKAPPGSDPPPQAGIDPDELPF